MIPLHYFLALFAVLVSLLGCSQNAPPGSSQTTSINNKTGLKEETPNSNQNQTINHDHDPIIKPLNTTGETTFELTQPEGSLDWILVMKGGDAEVLYKVMAIKEQRTDRAHRDLDAVVKYGKQMDCYQLSVGAYQCEFAFDSETGEMKVQHEYIKADDADEVLTELYVSNSMKLYSASKGGSISIKDEVAQKVFDGMTKVDSDILFASVDYTEGKRKKALNVDCYQQFLVATPHTPLYSCNFWILNSTTGEFDKFK